MRRKNAASVASTSSNGPWIWQILRMRTRPASSIISALMTPGFRLSALMSARPSSTALRVSITQSGQTEWVLRGTPRGIAERVGRSDGLTGAQDEVRSPLRAVPTGTRQEISEIVQSALSITLCGRALEMRDMTFSLDWTEVLFGSYRGRQDGGLQKLHRPNQTT